MEAIILAGGYGTRLQSIVRDVPKPMADINGRPFLSYVVDHLSCQNMRKILLSVGYKYEIIKNYFGLKYKNIDIEYVIENEPLGTGGAIKKALNQIDEDNAVVLNGDSFFDLDLQKMFHLHSTQGSRLTIAVKPMHRFDRYGTVVLEGNRVMSFEEKSSRVFGYINGGVYIVDKGIFNTFEQYNNSFSFEKDFLEKKVDIINPLAFIAEGYFIDIGIPDDYERAKKDMKNLFQETVT